MAVTLLSTGGLFTSLGKLAKVHHTALTLAGGNLETYMNAAIAALGTEYALFAPLTPALLSAQSSLASNPGSVIRSVAQAVLLKMVNDDAPQSDKTSVPLAVAELVRQMIVSVDSVPSVTVTATSSAASGNSGDGAVVLATKRIDGLVQQNMFAETGELIFTGDAQSGSATAAQEPWSFRGDYATTDQLSHLWPGYSGAAAGGSTINSQVSGTGPGVNLVANGGMETYTVTNIPDGWTLVTGAATTDYARESGTVHRGTYSYKWIGSASVAQSKYYQFPANVIRPNRVYAFHCRLRASATLPTGPVLRARLTNGSNSVITDDQSVSNQLTGVATQTIPTGSWQAYTGTFITPRVLPSAVRLGIFLDDVLTSGKNLFVDSVAMAEHTFLYPGGPGLAVFAGATPWVIGDRYSVTTANNRNSATYGATWNCYFDRWFNMRQLGLILPYSGSPTVADSLLTA